MICAAKRKVLDGLNKRYIYGRVVCPRIPSQRRRHRSAYRGVTVSRANRVVIVLQPLLHTIIFLVEMAVAARLAAKFNAYYAEKPGKLLAATSRSSR